MKICVSLECAKGKALAVSSKSDIHRILICAALSDRKTEISINSLSRDIYATADCLNALGAKIDISKDKISVIPVSSSVSAPKLDCCESGSTLRFLLPVAAAVSETPSLFGEGRLPSRPLMPLISQLEAHGCSFSSHSLPLTLCGKPQSGIYALPGDISSQFVSGLLFALPLLDGDSEIRLLSPLESAPYVDMTVSSLEKFGIEVQKTPQGFFVRGNQKYISPQKITAEGDWSNSAPLFVLGAVSGQVTLSGLSENSLQGDRYILSVLSDFGAEISCKKGESGETEEITVTMRKKMPFSVDVSQTPDLFPYLAVLALAANGKSVISGAKRLKIKESDRISAVLSLIRALGGNAEYDDFCGTFTVNGCGSLKGGNCDSFSDHRIAMAAAISAAISDSPVTIDGFEAINKSYPTFLNHFKALGGHCQSI